MSFFSEFKQFAVKGNVIDLAVAVVIGAAFGSIVTSLVNDLIMPPIGMITGGVDFTELKIQLSNPVMEGEKVIKEGASINYGNFIQTIVNFLIIALAIFAMVKSINSLKRKEEAAPATPTLSKEEILLTEIRDLLRNRNL
ncbi:large-conductance mechanosensitive channel protein MscL [Adhaeribacter aquaticus]|uniref:large-conductance mechanosensitive channel protein MscL n=1 Tax=Adhaeribacter aquaticus TaxID=299567 RepID=UPI0003F82555|nr:large-conductance mechanosensitive channel protein MscL [Adhaeribacter aquaticus]